MKGAKIRILLATVTVLLMALGLVGTAGAAGSGGGKGQIVSAFGKVGDKIVHVLVVVPPGANASEVANAAVRGQGARPIDSQEFSTTGLVWDIFSDTNANNDHVDVNYNSDGAPDNLSALDPRGIWWAAQSTWNVVSGSNFVFADTGDTTRCPSLVKECRGRQSFDGNNDVGWIDIKDPNVLGVTWYGTKTDEFDMALDNTNFTWYIGAIAEDGTIPADSYDVQTVWLHEFGHAAGLGHSDVSGAVMEPYYGGPLRTLSDDDKAGIIALYGPPNDAPVVTITSPIDGATFDSGATVSFTGDVSDTEDDDSSLTEDLVWSSDIQAAWSGSGGSPDLIALIDGRHTITASVTDSGGAAGSASISITVGTVVEPTTVSVVSISYATEGGRNGDKHLLITVALQDDFGDPVSGASVSISVNRNGGFFGSGTGTTGSGGTLTFTAKNIPPGTYVTTVTNVVAGDLTWDGGTPTNSHTK